MTTTTEPEGRDVHAALETVSAYDNPQAWFTMFAYLEARDTVAGDSADAVTVYSEVEALAKEATS